MKILYVVTGLGGGGAEKVVAGLADEMSKLGHQVKIAYLKGQVIVCPENSEIELINLGFESVKNSKVAYKNYKKLLKEFQPDIVHAHMVHANIFARISRIFFPIPKLICTAHNANEGGKLRMLAYKYTDKLSDLNTNVSFEATEAFVKMNAFNANSIPIYNGIDLNKFKFHLNKEKNKIIQMIAIGRLNQQKDYPNLLHALNLIKEKQICFKLSIVGEGEERENLENLIDYYNLNDSVELLGRRNNISDLLQNKDIFILSSAFEGFGLVVAEAMASNVFTIATDCGGVKEVMGGTGILVPPKNSYQLADAILEAIEMDNKQILENNVTAYNYVKKNFDLKVIVEKWLDIYAS